MTWPMSMHDTYAAIIDETLADSDMTTVTIKQVRAQLQAKLAHDVSPYKEEIGDLILERFNAAAAHPPPSLLPNPHEEGKELASVGEAPPTVEPTPNTHVKFKVDNGISQGRRTTSSLGTGRSAADEVFGITELASLIVQYLDYQDMARVQYTCQMCRALVRGNKAFLRAWYLEPLDGGPVKPVRAPIHANPKRVRWVSAVSPTPEYTPVTGQIATSHAAAPSASQEQRAGLESSQASSSARLRAVIRSTSLRQARQFQQPPVLNPHLQRGFPKWSYYAINNMVGLEQPLPETEAWRNPEASWRAMLLMQPPVGEVFVMDRGGKVFRAQNGRGVTMGDVYDAVETGKEVEGEQLFRAEELTSMADETIVED